MQFHCISTITCILSEFTIMTSFIRCVQSNEPGALQRRNNVINPLQQRFIQPIKNHNMSSGDINLQHSVMLALMNHRDNLCHIAREGHQLVFGNRLVGISNVHNLWERMVI